MGWTGPTDESAQCEEQSIEVVLSAWSPLRVSSSHDNMETATYMHTSIHT